MSNRLTPSTTRRFREAMRNALARCATLAILASTPAIAAEDCHETAKIYGAMMRASLLCNFPERPAVSKAMAMLHEVCPASSEMEFKQAIRPGIEEGFRIFEQDRKRDGDNMACAEWDKLMRVIGEE